MATQAVNSSVNRAFQGTDVPEMGYKVANLVPSISVPTMHRIEKAVDTVGDVLGDAVENLDPRGKKRKRDPIEPMHPNMQGSRWMFARLMGEKARTALIEQGVCKPYQLITGRRGLNWQHQLNQQLAEYYEVAKDEYRLHSLLEMKPVWVGDRERRVWKLVLDTGIIDVDVVDGEFLEEVFMLKTGIDILEQRDWVSIRDYTRGMKTVEGGEWEEVDVY